MTSPTTATAAIALALVALCWIAALARFFFLPGTWNVQWWLNTLPFAGAGVGMLALLLGRATPLVEPTSPAGGWLAVAAVLVIAGALGLSAFTLGTHRRRLALWHQHDDDPEHLVTEGPYAWIRHPFYTSYVATMVGCVLAAPHGSTLAMLAVVVYRLNGTAAREEARFLASERLGGRYAAYVRRTGRFVPRWGGLPAASPVPTAPGGRTGAGAVVREASDADGAAFLSLARSSSASRGVRWSIERNPDAFARFRAEAGGWWVALAEDEATGTTLGSVSVAVREAYVAGRVRRTAYGSSLLVRPEHRRRGVGDRLHRFAAELCCRAVGEDGLVLAVVREGNRHMRGRVRGPRGLPTFSPCAGVVIHSIRTRPPPTRAWRGRYRGGRVEVRAATTADLEEMATLGRGVFARRQFGPAFDADSLGRWIEGAPGLELSDHLVAHEGAALVGWMGVWDGGVFRRAKVEGYSHLATLVKVVHDALAPLTRRPRFPKVGDVVGSAAVVHACVPEDRPDVLRSMLLHAADGLHARGCIRLRIALDARDGLASALAGLRTRSRSFGAYVTTPGGSYEGPPLDGRPLHFEAALA